VSVVEGGGEVFVPLFLDLCSFMEDLSFDVVHSESGFLIHVLLLKYGVIDRNRFYSQL
jgi:hypothetical protein